MQCTMNEALYGNYHDSRTNTDLGEELEWQRVTMLFRLAVCVFITTRRYFSGFCRTNMVYFAFVSCLRNICA